MPPPGEHSEKSIAPLSADPEIGYFNPGGGTSEHMLANTSDKRMAVKIRCTGKDYYRVLPATLFIEAGSCQNITVTRLPGPVRVDKLIIQYKECAEEDQDVKKFFAELDKSMKLESIKVMLKMMGDRASDQIYTSYERIDA